MVRKDKEDLGICNIKVIDLIREARTMGNLEGQNEILKKLVEQKLKIVLIPKLKWEATP